MKQEYSLLIIKPGFLEHADDAINILKQKAGIQVLAEKVMKLENQLLAKHYAEHFGKPFYDGLLQYMSSDKVKVYIVKGNEGVVAKIREVAGSTKNPEPGTIRALFGIGEVTRNVIHSSDSPENGKREILNFLPYFSNISEKDIKNIKD